MLFEPLPNNAQIELVEGCNRMCSFCGIHSIWKNKEDRVIKYMDTKLAFRLANSFGHWFTKGKRIEFAMHGEPTLHPDLMSIIKKFCKSNPKAQLQLTTNGSIILMKGVDFITELFESGLNVLIIDTYMAQGVLASLAMQAKQTNPDLKVYDYYYHTEFNPYHYHSGKIKVICMMEDLTRVDGKRSARKIINHAGNSNQDNLTKMGVLPINKPLIKQCSRPFREISVHWDGTVSLCCLDWRHEFVIAKYPETELSEIWHDNHVLHYMRFLLQNKWRYVRPCYRCNYNGGFRLGLLSKVYYLLDYGVEVLHNHITKMKQYEHKNADPNIFFRHKTGIRGFSI